MSILKNIRKLIQKTGFDIRRHNILNSCSLHQSILLKKLKIDQVVDIGANSGQYALGLRSSGYSGKLLSIEPLSGPHNELSLKAKNDQNWIVYKRCAVGSFDGEIMINQSANSVSSSLLPMLDAHIQASSDSAYIGQELTPICRLDSILAEMNVLKGKVLLKIDTQGYEYEVLMGSTAALNHTRCIIIELSLQQLYEGQKDWIEIVAFLKSIGFSLWGLHPVFGDIDLGRLLQVDGIFLRD